MGYKIHDKTYVFFTFQASCKEMTDWSFFVGAYIKKLRNAIGKYPKDLIYNMDETYIHAVNQTRLVIVPIGTDSEPYVNNGNPKKCFTLIGTISYSSSSLPLWFF